MKKLICSLCGKKSEDVVMLLNDSSCSADYWGGKKKRIWVSAGENVCSSHRPYAFLSEKQDKAS